MEELGFELGYALRISDISLPVLNAFALIAWLPLFSVSPCLRGEHSAYYA